MRPIGIGYGQPMLDYLTLVGSTDLANMPYFMAGHPVEISNRLLDKNNKGQEYKKYPLIALKMDIEESFDEGLVDYNLNIAIFCYTDKNWNAEERIENVFKPVLAPLYDEFIKQLNYSGLFQWEGDSRVPPHKRILRPYWGNSQKNGNTEHMFSDPLDAIEIQNLKLKKLFNEC